MRIHVDQCVSLWILVNCFFIQVSDVTYFLNKKRPGQTTVTDLIDLLLTSTPAMSHLRTARLGKTIAFYCIIGLHAFVSHGCLKQKYKTLVQLPEEYKEDYPLFSAFSLISTIKNSSIVK